MRNEGVDLSRRGFIRLAATLGCAAAVSPLASLMLPDSAEASPMVPLRLHNPHTKETYSVHLFTGSKWNSNGLLVCDWMMRDWRQNRVVSCDRKLYAALYVIQRKFGADAPINVNSGFRSAETNQMLRSNSLSRSGGRSTSETPAVNSLHLLARAVDFAIPGVPVRDVAAYVRELKIGGLGTYSTFTHMDTGRVREW